MIQIILCGHGNLALAMKGSIEMVYGHCESITAIPFHPHENRESLVKKITAILDPDSPTLIVVDLFGGTPFNAASEIAFPSANIEVISGMSLPLCLALLERLTELSLPELVEYLVEVGKQCVMALQKNLISDDLEVF